ncbi:MULTISPECIES: restriction endonuclease subunit S [unclassified Empedobacter]|uniref:restriction endonuclease subunit S n=1 Tax=unclassified Empedobacter TaxID=2643773 RepID=UPI0025C4A4F4|nr:MULTISPECIES: restriction endonuclease subunit S [unclassified Empedobacter]
MRFPEFTEEWNREKIASILTIGSGKDYKHLSKGTIPVFGTGGYMASVDDFLYEGESVCIGRKGTINKPLYFNGKFWTVDTLFYTHSFKNVLPKFVYNIFEQINWLKYNEASGVPSLSKSTIEQIDINIPCVEEQQKIATFLSLIDERIQAQNKIIEELKLLKITISKKLFSRQLRFKNGNNENYIDWNTKNLGEVTTLINKRNKNNEKLPVYSINNKLGFVPQSEQFEGVDSEDRGYDIKLYKIIDKNTFAYNPARINVGSIGYSENLENIIISSLYVCFKTDNTVNDNFLFQYLKTDFFNREVLRNVEGGVRDYLFYDNFARIKFDLPCIEEQKKIADYLSSINSKIDIESQLLHKFEEQKRYLLANLFI